MVYNALKLFMEMNPELFQQCQDNYKAQRKASVHFHLTADQI
jgi:serine/threonine-protein phosphatase 2A regulatory subunit B'